VTLLIGPQGGYSEQEENGAIALSVGGACCAQKRPASPPWRR
jgi:hypothetical protein